jgi:monoamine oxidase
MPGLGDPLVREMRARARAHAAFPGRLPTDPEEPARWHETEWADEKGKVGGSGFSRREFLKRGAAVGAGMAGASALGWGRPRPAFARDANVVIVGAGLAGLTCAYDLMRHGIASTVYESRDRVGGRCWTIRVFDNGQTAEHGGQYLDSRHRHIRRLAKDLHVPLVDTEAQSFPAGTGDYFWFDGAFHTSDEIFADFDLVLDRIKADYQRVGRYFYNQAGTEAIAFDQMSLNDWLDQNVPGGLTSLLAQAIERSNTGFWGLDGDQLSAINLFEFYVVPYPGADERFRVAGGNDVIPNRLAEELPDGGIRYEQPLEAAWTRSDGKIGLRFIGEARDVVADVAVFALPFTVLRDVDTSGLDMSARRRRAIDTLAMGTNAKLQFQLNRTLADVDWSGAFRSDDPEFGTWDSTYGQSDPHPATPVVTIYTGGRAGAGYPTDVPHATAPSAIVDAALDALARGVADIHDAYNGIAYLDSWVDDPWVHGSYAGFAPGQYTDFWGFLERREGNALFAGEHTSTHSQGYLNGGVESGDRAARQVLNTLRVRTAAA